MSSSTTVPPLNGPSLRWCLVLTLLAPLAHKLSAQPKPQTRNVQRREPATLPVVNQGYLASASPLPLRFAAARAPLPEVGMPVTHTTSRYATESAVADTAQANQDAALNPNEPATTTPGEVIESNASDTSKPVPAPTLRIIPDDVIREVPPEELIPYFELPGTNGGSVLIPLKPTAVPMPESLPRSSATFQQR